MENITDEHLITLFDQLVAEGVIIYGPHEKHFIETEGYPIEFRVCPALAKKPHTVGASLPSFNQTRKWGPGSDMFIPDPRLILCQVNKTHDLAFNLFSVDRPQLLMVTRDSYRRQHEPLDADDFAATLELLSTLKGWYVIFNCGEKGGCSRVHKHIQGLRGPPYAFSKFVEASEGKGEVPFKFFMKRFENSLRDIPVSELLGVYKDLLAQCRQVLQIRDGDMCPHNVVLWDNSIVVIPRRSGMWKGASTNTVGMMGSVWVKNQAEMDKWLQLGPANILREVGIPR